MSNLTSNTKPASGPLEPGTLARVAALALIFAVNTNVVAQPCGYKLPRPDISETFPYRGHYAGVDGVQMFYVDEGQGDPVVFIHGNPTSSYLWRNVIPYVAGDSRAVALDLVGMGRSGKLDIGYRYMDHYRYLEGFIDALDLKNITFVVHDWGAALGFDYARLHPDRVKAIAFMEGVLPPAFPQPSYEAMGEEMGGMFRAMRDPVQGREMVIDNHMFVEQILPGFVNRTLGEEAMAEYRRPFVGPASREPILAWPREVPIAGEPADVTERLEAIGAFMTETDLPVLLLYADPGVVVPPQAVGWYTGHMKNIETAYVGQGLHFIQEDQPDAIGRALSDWIRRHRDRQVQP